LIRRWRPVRSASVGSEADQVIPGQLTVQPLEQALAGARRHLHPAARLAGELLGPIAHQVIVEREALARAVARDTSFIIDWIGAHDVQRYAGLRRAAFTMPAGARKGPRVITIPAFETRPMQNSTSDS
jgi:hypothetical protein